MLLEKPLNIIPGYLCREIIQRGQIFDIYRSKRLTDSETVFLKVLVSERPSLPHLARLRHEFEIGKDLRARHIARPLALEHHKHRLGLVFDNFDGCPLDEFLEGRQIDLLSFLKVAIQITGALCELHDNDITHNRLGSRNVFIDPASGRVQIADLGMASRLSAERRRVGDFDPADGALVYMSPEQTGRINRDVDDRTDLYSLGVIFYEALCGHPPFEEAEPIELVHAHIARSPVPVHERRSDIPEAISQIVSRLLAKSPEERYQTAMRVKVHLERCLSEFEQHGVISSPASGFGDVVEKFRIPQKLYGREREISLLSSALERASQGRSEMAVVRGPAGIGKSSLVNEMSKSIAELNGYFITAKYNELRQNVPYSALIGAVSELVHQLLTESETRKAYWKSRLSDALGPNGRVITDVVPAVGLITGPQPDLDNLGPTESQNRFIMIWQRFTKAFASAKHPLVLFLDDLQWADSASMELIQNLVTDPRNGHVFLIAAYRDDEIGISHPLSGTLAEIEKKGGNITNVCLGPLDRGHLDQWISEALNTDPETVTPLSQKIFENTHGNPFFVSESLRTIDRHGLFRLDSTRDVWEFNLEEISKVLVPSDNVIDLFLRRIEDLSPNAKDSIKVASCIGNKFDLTVFCDVRDQSLSLCGRDMTELIDAGLVQPMSDFELSVLKLQSAPDPAVQILPQFRFLHDRVREAAYSLLTGDERKATHLKLGELYLARQREIAGRDDIAFATVDHLNLARTLITDRARTEELVRLNLSAGRSAKKANAYESASNYFSIGIQILSGSDWGGQDALSATLQLEMAESDYLTGRIDSAEERCDKLLDKASDDNDRLRVYRLKLVLYTSQSRHEKALKTGVEAAKLLGMKLLENPGPTDIINEFVRAKWRLRGKADNDLMGLPEMVNPLQNARMELLAMLVAPAFQSNPVFAIVVALRMLNASLRHGWSKITPFSYMIYGVVNSAFAVTNLPVGDFKSAYRFGQLALRLKDELEHVAFGYLLHFLFATAVNQWTEHARSNIGHLESAYKGALSAGDLVYADYSLVTLIVDSYFKGDPLDQVALGCDRYFDFYDRHKGSDRLATAQGQSALIHQQLIACLRGETEASSSLSSGSISENELLRHMRDDMPLFAFGTAKMQVRLLFDDYKDVPEEISQTSLTMEGMKAMADIRLSEYYLYHGLIMARLCSGESTGQHAYKRRLRQQIRSLKTLALASPENYGHRCMLLEAEMARIQGKHWKAMALYDDAIEAARASEYLQIEALASEHAGRFYLEMGREKTARYYMLDACYAYRKWGATAKLVALRDQYPELHLDDATRDRVATSEQGATQLEIAAVLKAARLISSEVFLGGLLRKLMQVLVENAGAEKVVLLLNKNGNYRIEGVATVGKDSKPDHLSVLKAVPVEDSNDIAQSVVAYVSRTRDKVVLHDALAEKGFSKDPYIAANKSRSILCMPLFHKEEISAIIYLENSLTPYAFTPAHAEFLETISGQMAISLENAMLFEKTEGFARSANRFVPHDLLSLFGREFQETSLGDGVLQENMNILVSDIRGFTALSENMTPEQNFRFINDYLKQVGPLIRENRGFVGKYTGDGLMAFFPGSADDALEAALATLQRVSEYNAKRDAANQPAIRIGMGVHRGSAMLGIIGEEERLQCDAMSDAANLAARLEGLSSIYGVSIVLSKQVFRVLDAAKYQYRSLGRAQIIGREKPVSIYEFFGGDPNEAIRLKTQTKSNFESGLELYAKRRFSEASELFREVLQQNPQDKAAKLYLDDSSRLAENGVPPNWLGAPALGAKKLH